jgi:2,4'-dihydroxyacetophenone dioxygenase
MQGAPQDLLHALHVKSSEDWVDTEIDGLQTQDLWEREDGASFALLKFKKGAGIARAHRHASNQFMYCLSGTYSYINGPTLAPGDFYMNPMGVEHGPTEALEDCILLEVYDGPHYFS